MRKLSLLAAAVLAAASFTGASAVQAADVDFHGYFRSGVGVSKDGGNMSWAKTRLGRLGNEDDTYGELEFGANLYETNGVSFYMDSMLAMTANGSNGWEATSDDDANFALCQFNLQVKGLIPGQPDAVVWAGKRYYQREDIHIIDIKYLEISGPGAGIEYLKLGPGALSLAWIRADANDTDYRYDGGEGTSNTNVNFLDARYAGSYWDGGWLEFVGTVAMPQDPDSVTYWDGNANNGKGGYVNGEQDGIQAEYDNGTSFLGTVVLSQNVAGGYNKTVFQYATKGLANSFVSWMNGGGSYDTYDDCDDAKGFRIINTGEIPITDDFRFNHSLVYGYVSDGADQKNIDNEQIISAVVRGTVQTSQYSRIMAEVGAFKQTTKYKNDKDKDEVSGQKYTLALAFAPGKEILSRPELRIYASYIHASDDARVSNATGAEIYDSNFNFGVQAEAWW